MALRNLNKSGQRWLGTPYNGLLAEQILAETATGDDGPGALYNEAQQSEYVGKRLRMHVSAFPPVGTLQVDENGAYSSSGLPPGSNVFGYTFYVDGVLQAGSASLTINVGSLGSTAPGATLGITETISPGSAQAANPGGTVAPGAALGITETLSAGSAQGSTPPNSAAPGATLGMSVALTPGSAQAETPAVIIDPGPDGYRIRAIRRIDSANKVILPAKDPEEIITITWDFSGLSDEIVSALLTASVLSGLNDITPQSILYGQKGIAGPCIMQRLSGGQDDTTYALRCKATDADGSIYVQTAALPVRVASPG